jgi:hypothetical protein
MIFRLLAFSLLILHKIAKEPELSNTKIVFESGIINQQKIALRI